MVTGQLGGESPVGKAGTAVGHIPWVWLLCSEQGLASGDKSRGQLTPPRAGGIPVSGCAWMKGRQRDAGGSCLC